MLVTMVGSSIYLHTMMPYLSAYMGHAKVSETYYYIHLVPGMHEEMSDFRYESAVDIFPKVVDSSVNQRLMILRSFLKYAGETDCAFVAVGIDVATVPTRKTKGRQVEFLLESTFKTLLAQPDARTKTGHRNQFFMILMLVAAVL